METKTAQQPKSEVSVRTLASDEESIATGKLVPKIIATDVDRTEELEDENSLDQPKTVTHKGRHIVMLIVLLAILAVGYFVVYPMLKEAFKPSVN